MKYFIYLLPVLCTCFLSSCATQKKPPADLKKIYGVAAKNHSIHRNPVIIIPGILGSELYDTQTKGVLWGVYDNNYEGLKSPESIRSIALPMKQGAPLRSLKDSVIATKTLDKLRFRIAGIPITPHAYAAILKTLGVGGYLDEDVHSARDLDYGKNHFTCFQFSYDWRLSNADNAARLDAFISDKKKYVRAQYKKNYGIDKKDIKFDIIAHSMGGLMARYYLRYGKQSLPQDGSLPKLTWAGAKNVEKVVLVGTPNSGSVLAFAEAVQGKDFSPKWARVIPNNYIPKFPASVIGTYPSIFELMPRTRHRPLVDTHGKTLDFYDINLWKKYEWGFYDKKNVESLSWLLPDAASDAERYAIVSDHLQKCLTNAKSFHRAMDLKVKKPEDLSLTLVVGDGIDTKERLKVDTQNGKIKDDHYAPGDHTVLRSSVLADERAGGPFKSGLRSPIDYDHVIFLPRDHIDLTSDVTFSNNILHILLEK